MGSSSSKSSSPGFGQRSHFSNSDAPPPAYSKEAQEIDPTLLAAISDPSNLGKDVPQAVRENALASLRRYDTVLIVDDSGSMEGQRWLEAREALAELAAVASKYDANGIDISFLNSSHRGKGLKSASKVRDIFNKVTPEHSTPLGPAIRDALQAYKKQLSDGKRRKKDVKPVNYIVITDGRPDDEIDLSDAIVKFAQWLDKEDYPITQVGIQFVQIGDDRQASRYLAGLDTTLSSKNGIRDMVDTEPYNGPVNAAKLIKLMIGGINRRVDIKGGEVMLYQ